MPAAYGPLIRGTIRGKDAIMSTRLILDLRRMAALCLLTLALLATGFAHRAPSAQDDALQSAWALSGGNWSGICGDATGDGQRTHVKCPACQLAGAAGLPPAPAAAHGVAPRLVAVLAAPAAEAPVRAVLDRAHGSRAPPLA